MLPSLDRLSLDTAGAGRRDAPAARAQLVRGDELVDPERFDSYRGIIPVYLLAIKLNTLDDGEWLTDPTALDDSVEPRPRLMRLHHPFKLYDAGQALARLVDRADRADQHVQWYTTNMRPLSEQTTADDLLRHEKAEEVEAIMKVYGKARQGSAHAQSVVRRVAELSVHPERYHALVLFYRIVPTGTRSPRPIAVPEVELDPDERQATVLVDDGRPRW